MDDFDLEFIQPFTKVLNVLNEYGWIVSPHMIGKDFEKLKKLCEQIETDASTSEEERGKSQSAINEFLTTIVFHPLTRAFFVYRSQELKFISEFSHHIERATIHYLKKDYFSSVHCLLPAIEGTLLSYYGWQYGSSRKPSIKNLIDEIERCRLPVRKQKQYQLYSFALGRFLKTWIFSDTNTADMSLSYLNRHYVLHGMGNKNYYSLADCQRLIVFFDLLIEFLAVEEGKTYAFIPESNEKINKREDYYFKLLSQDVKSSFISQKESELFNDHNFYYAEQNAPDWNYFMKAAVKEYVELMSLINSFRRSKK